MEGCGDERDPGIREAAPITTLNEGTNEPITSEQSGELGLCDNATDLSIQWVEDETLSQQPQINHLLYYRLRGDGFVVVSNLKTEFRH